MTNSLTRRAMLGALTTLAGGMAGCGGRTSDGDNTPSTTTTTTTPIASVEVGSTALEVRLVEDHDVTELVLHGPADDPVARTTVSTDTQSVSLPILAVEPDRAGYEHYQPGQHTLVAETPDEAHSTAVSLQPDLRITKVEQYRDGESPASLGKVAVTVENRGSGPTWVYDIAFEGSPNFAANDTVLSDPGIVRLAQPNSLSEVILASGDTQTLVSEELPLLFTQSNNSDCSLTNRFRVTLGTPVGGNPSTVIQTHAGGDVHSIDSLSGYTCSQTAAELSSVSGGSE